MKILFCISQIDFCDHIALPYLSAIAKKRGHVTDMAVLDNFEKKVEEFHPDIVAFSLNISGYDGIVEVHKRLKGIYNYKSIGGGPHVTLNQDLYPTSGMDVWCVGEGEGAWEDYLACVENGQSYERVPNLITPSGQNPVRRLITNLDTIPFPDRDLTLANTFLGDLEKKTFYTTRGCPFGCTYCGNSFINELYRGNKILRRFSVQRLIDEVTYVRSRYRLDFVKIGDDCFAFKVDDWLREFAERWPKEVGLPWNCYQRFDVVNDEMLALMQKAGCYSMTLSVDSLSEFGREKVLGRHQRRVDIEKQLLLIRSYGINTFVNFMLGTPGTTIQDDLDTIDFAIRAKVVYLPYSITTPMRGTKLYDYSFEHEIVPPDYDDEIIQREFFGRSVYTCFTEKEKDIQENIHDLGGVTILLPSWLRWFGYLLIKHTPPNKFYHWVRLKYRNWMVEHKVFKIKRKVAHNERKRI